MLVHSSRGLSLWCIGPAISGVWSDGGPWWGALIFKSSPHLIYRNNGGMRLTNNPRGSPSNLSGGGTRPMSLPHASRRKELCLSFEFSHPQPT